MRHRPTILALPLALLCLVPPAWGATLKPYTALETGVVRLCDLFEGADARPLGPAPAPGARITVEAQQLGAIARMFGVEWRPAGPGDRSILERPGRTLVREDVMAPLRALLDGTGAPRDSDIELPGFTLPPIPANAVPSLDFANTAYDPSSGRFTTTLTATVEGMAPMSVRLSGRVQEMAVLPVTRRAMLPGEVVGAQDLQWTRLRVGLTRGEVVRQPAQAEGQALRRSIPANQPIQMADLGRPVLVFKGSPLLLSLETPGISLTAQGVAAEPGGLGERIRVTNTYSRTTLEAEITGPGKARVIPGSAGAASQVAAR